MPALAAGNGKVCVPALAAGKGTVCVPALAAGNGTVCVPALAAGNGTVCVPALSKICLNVHKIYFKRGKLCHSVKKESKSKETKKVLYNFALLRCCTAFVGRNIAKRRSYNLGRSRRHKSRKKQLEIAVQITV